MLNDQDLWNKFYSVDLDDDVNNCQLISVIPILGITE